ncbi:MAG: pyrroline-5-carboxylate reductase [Pygmaiobacter sp.]
MGTKLGFIGCGNMAKAMIGGIVSSGILPASEVYASNRSEGALAAAKEKWGIKTTRDNTVIAAECEVVVLAVKPQFYEEVIAQIVPFVRSETIVVTIAPGFTLQKLTEMFGKPTKLVRTMPNTPAMVCEGMTAVCKGELVTEEELQFVLSLLRGFGKAELIEEYMMEAVVAVSGSSPAYIYMMIEAMADAAVLQGLPREKAYQFAAQAVYGSAKMVLETGLHPGALKDMVCSPRGTTIEAVRVLEKKGLRSSVMEAMTACAEKARNM